MLRRNFLRTLATAVVGAVVTPKVILAEVAPIIAPIAPAIDYAIYSGAGEFRGVAKWGQVRWGEPPYWFTEEGRAALFNMKEPAGY